MGDKSRFDAAYEDLSESLTSYYAGTIADLKKKVKKLPRERDLVPEDQYQKADLRWLRKVARWVVDYLEKSLKPHLAAEDYERFLRMSLDTYNRYVSDRTGRFPMNKGQVYNSLVTSLKAQVANSVRTQGKESQGLVTKVQKAMRGKSDLELVIAGLKSGKLASYHIADLAKQVRSISHGDPEQLRALLKALK